VIKPLRYTLVADGSSDRVLIPILNWLFDQCDISYQPQFADRLPIASRELRQRVIVAIKLYPCDLLFVHRDAEAMPFKERVVEIENKLAGLENPFLSIVPVRMTEAWLLSSEAAIRSAAGNPKGTTPLGLPPWREWETKPDPKGLLFKALRAASELHGRRLRGFSEDRARHRVAELTEDYTLLAHLEAFAELREKLNGFVEEWRDSLEVH
jgi:hypothetical protein